MVIFVTKTSCPRREMTSLALTVCAHIAATHYTPRYCAFEYRFLPLPNLTPNPPSALTYASLVAEVMGRGMGMALAGVPIASLVVEVLGKGMGMAPVDVPIVSLVVEGMERGMGMAQAGMPIDLAGGGGDGKGEGDGSGGYVICLAAGGGVGKGDGDGSGGYALGLAAGGSNGRYHALVLSGAEVNPPESLLVL